MEKLLLRGLLLDFDSSRMNLRLRLRKARRVEAPFLRAAVMLLRGEERSEQQHYPQRQLQHSRGVLQGNAVFFVQPPQVHAAFWGM